MYQECQKIMIFLKSKKNLGFIWFKSDFLNLNQLVKTYIDFFLNIG